MSYKILESRSPQGLEKSVNELIEQGWKPLGSHQVVVSHSQNQFRGSQHAATIHSTDYTQTMVKEDKEEKTLLTEEEVLKRGYM